MIGKVLPKWLSHTGRWRRRRNASKASNLHRGRWQLKCQHLSTRGRWVVKKGQNFVHMVFEWPPISGHLWSAKFCRSGWVTRVDGAGVAMPAKHPIYRYVMYKIDVRSFAPTYCMYVHTYMNWFPPVHRPNQPIFSFIFTILYILR